MVAIRYYQDTDKTPWDSYVMNHPQGTFFHLTGWKKVVEKTFAHKPYYLIAEESNNYKNSTNATDPSEPTSSNESTNSKNTISTIDTKRRIVGILPLFSVKSFLFCKSLVSIPFAAYGGILADNGEISDQLLEKAKKIISLEKLEFIEIRNRSEEIANLRTKDLYVTFRREISQDLNSNMMAIPRKARRMIRQGEKAGLTYEFGGRDLISPFYEIFAMSYHRLGSPVFPRKLFENMLEEFSDQANILLIISSDRKPISGVLTFYYKQEVLPYYAGSLFEYRELAPNDFMYWQLMKYGCENGYKIFDFGRSKFDTGSYDFKRHWGFEAQSLPYQYYLNGIEEIPNISPANPKYQRKIEIWKKLPLWATKLIGPQIVKYIP